MARFRYRMQGVLDMKEKLEDQAKIEFASAKARLNEEEKRLHELYVRKERYEEEGREVRENRLDTLKMKENTLSLERMKEFIEAQLVVIEEVKVLVEEKRVRLQELSVERKMHEKLKEKAFEEFVKEENSKESKEVDELTTYIYGRKAINGNASGE